MSKTYKTEAVVLRTIRYGEADRVLNLYTAAHGRVGAIAKGVRRTRSRFGGRLEPFFRVELVLHEGRGELATVTAAETIAGYPSLRSRAESIQSAQHACYAVLQLLDARERNAPAYNLLVNHLDLIDREPAASTRAVSLAFRIKLLVAAGFGPELAACANCGRNDDIAGFSPSVGGVICSDCVAGSFEFGPAAHEFLCQALSSPLADAPTADRPALTQAERAITETLEHHANVRLRSVA